MAGEFLTLAEASALTGVDVRALRRRADRGTLRVERRGRFRVVSVAELERAGLLGEGEGDVLSLAKRVERLERAVDEIKRRG